MKVEGQPTKPPCGFHGLGLLFCFGECLPKRLISLSYERTSLPFKLLFPKDWSSGLIFYHFGMNIRSMISIRVGLLQARSMDGIIALQKESPDLHIFWRWGNEFKYSPRGLGDWRFWCNIVEGWRRRP